MCLVDALQGGYSHWSTPDQWVAVMHPKAVCQAANVAEEEEIYDVMSETARALAFASCVTVQIQIEPRTQH